MPDVASEYEFITPTTDQERELYAMLSRFGLRRIAEERGQPAKTGKEAAVELALREAHSAGFKAAMTEIIAICNRFSAA